MDKYRHSMVGPLELAEMKRDFQIRFLVNHGLMPHHRLLDFGCGTLRGGVPIIRYLDAEGYCGVDVRPAVIQAAYQELLDNNLHHQHPALVNHLHQLPSWDFHYIWAFSVFIHIQDTSVGHLFDFFNWRILQHPEGVIYMNVNIGDHPDGKWQGFPVKWRSLDFYRHMADNNNLELEDMGELRTLGHQSGNELGDKQRMLRLWKR